MSSPSSFTNPDPAHRYKITFLELVDLLSSILAEMPNPPISPQMLPFVKTFFEGSSPYDMIGKFVHSTSPHWDQIKEKKQDFFAENMLSLVPQSYHSYLTRLPELFAGLDQPKREDIWIYVHTMVKISIHYVHEQRQPAWIGDAKRYSNRAYTGRTFQIPSADGGTTEVQEKNIPLAKWARLFEVTMVWPPQQ